LFLCFVLYVKGPRAGPNSLGRGDGFDTPLYRGADAASADRFFAS